VEIPIYNDEGVITGRHSLTDPNEVNTAIIEQNKKQFSQAKDTPFIAGGLSAVIHPFQQNDITESILEGTFDPDPFDDDTIVREFVRALQYPGDEAPSPIEVIISTEDLRMALKKIRESTSSSPSGRHLGHYKAVINDDELLGMYAQLLTIPFWCGFGLSQWKYAIQAMLEKLSSRPWIEKLRIIQLIEADLNAAAKILFA
jgi:hypothetical protein